MAAWKNWNNDNNSSSTPVFTGALSQIYRLDALWQACNRAAIDGNYVKWSNILDRVWLEFSGSMPHGNPHEKKFSFFATKLKEAKLGVIFGTTFKNPDDNEMKLWAEQYSLLLSKEGWLRKLEHEQGKGTVYQEEDSLID